jgi:X-domain of DnaJ-containing
MKDMTSAATSMMTDEEKTEMEKQMNSKPNGTSNSVTSNTKSEKPPVATATAPSQSTPAPTVSLDDSTKPAMATTVTENLSTPESTSHVVPHGSILPPASSATAADKDREKREAARRKAEQRDKLRELEKARRKAMEERVAMLTTKMIERLRPFVEAKDPGGSDDPESRAFEEKMKREVEDLKLESFGVEVCLGFVDVDSEINGR